MGGKSGVSLWFLNHSGKGQWKYQKSLPRPTEDLLRPTDDVNSLSWTDNGDRLVASYVSYGVIVWNITSSSVEKHLHNESAVISPDGNTFLVRAPGTFELRDIEGGRVLETLVDPDLSIEDAMSSDVVLPAVFMHDGYWLLTGSKGKAKLWRIDAKRVVQEIGLDNLLSNCVIRLLDVRWIRTS
ncbi:hypothetical protein NLJ89_g11864 [Agrocybe chaxingu]|uniref:Uncharacterized protein n=1 Tax=Agrocybe chaxingu TaxID=84603 RepID=A0A9W8JP75_9AGAR|nr:hypothetical protein NLJ89_g11864 [Agrocybe chaxingu]